MGHTMKGNTILAGLFAVLIGAAWAMPALAETRIEREIVSSSAAANGTNCWVITDPVPEVAGADLLDMTVYQCVSNGVAETVVAAYRVAQGGAITGYVGSVTATSGGTTSVVFNASMRFGDWLRIVGDQTNSAFKAAVMYRLN